MAAPTTALDDLDLRIGGFAARLYAVATVFTVAWALASGTEWDVWLIGFLICTTGGSLVPRLPWRNGQLLSKVLISLAGVILVVFMPLYLRQPALLILPALSAAYTGATVDYRWIASIIPAAIALGVGLADELGARAGWSQAMLHLGLSITTGSVAVWMRHQVARGNDAILAAQAEAAEEADRKATLQAQAAASAEAELEQRLELAGALQDLVEQATGTSSGIEGQSASIASAVDQLATSLQEASNSAQTTGMTVQRIAEATESSQDLIARLSDAGQQIVGIVDTITALSDQTNLLALNATIEAARAGEAGQGFAVVANEVKDLAQRTARSASGIGELIDEVQGRLTASTEAMDRVAAMVGELEEQQAALGASVAEQTEVVGGIATAANASAGGVAEFGQIIRQIEQRATVLQAVD